jgi:hypothetical protein
MRLIWNHWLASTGASGLSAFIWRWRSGSLRAFIGWGATPSSSHHLPSRRLCQKPYRRLPNHVLSRGNIRSKLRSHGLRQSLKGVSPSVEKPGSVCRGYLRATRQPVRRNCIQWKNLHRCGLPRRRPWLLAVFAARHACRPPGIDRRWPAAASKSKRFCPRKRQNIDIHSDFATLELWVSNSEI